MEQCNGCKEKIQKDTTRMGLTTMQKDAPTTRWFHLKCWKVRQTSNMIKHLSNTEAGISGSFCQGMAILCHLS